MQNKTLWYVVGVAVIIAVGGFILMNTNIVSAPTTTGNTAVETSPQLMSLKDLLARTGSETCSFTSSTQNSQSSGTVFINNGTMRGNFTSVTAGQTTQSHIIVKGDSVYVWSDGLPQGYKMGVASLTAQNGQTQPGGINASAPAGYACVAWSVDASVFLPPTGITFQTVGPVQ
jgi:hypothetical protein